MALPSTTQHSVLHRLFAGSGGDASPAWAKAFLAAVGCTYLPLLAAALIHPELLWKSPGPCPGAECIKLPFLHDWNIHFAFLISFPTLVALLITDDAVLRSSLRQVQEDGVMTILEKDFAAFADVWAKRFRRANFIGQVAGIAIGAVLAYLTKRIYINSDSGFWISEQQVLLPVGYVYVYCIALLYALITMYVLRSILISVFLNQLVQRAELHMMPFHPDKCGGFRPVSRLGLRNQYTLTILGLNVVLLATMTHYYLTQSSSLKELVIVAAFAYAILGPVVFIGPLMPFRTGMQHEKNEWMREIAYRVRFELERLRKQIRAGDVAKEDEEFIDRLRRIGGVVDELPVWPFDARTLRRFATAYIVPVGVTAIGKGVSVLFAWATSQ
ncbi:MAG TPA: hypothetical protein VII30_10305 [Gemmatimonadaceae bacterium]